jgi:outer membrane biosynthesis protein TonB
MQTTSEQKKGIVGTVIFHLLLMLALFLLVLRTPLPLPGEQGVEIRMGNSDEGTYSEYFDQSSVSSPVSTPSSQAQEEEIVTQSEEETVAIETQTKPQPQQKPQDQPITNPDPNPEPKSDPKPTVDPRALYPGSNTNTSGGGTGSSGDYGRPDGTSPTGDLTGGGQGSGQGSGSGTGQGSGSGDGQGRDYFLNNREVKYLKKPSYNSGESGRVVVEIRVDRDGNVVSARAGARVPEPHNMGTTTSDPNLLQQAKEAALQSKFSKDDRAAEQQTGYIVYNFIKQGE